jgi:hypothetical protein
MPDSRDASRADALIELAEAIKAIDGLIEVVRANVSRSGGPGG